ncbi:uncharacterized protein YpmS [Enterococcus rivorum]|uniref:Uncharacterized protein n=1 Tax=Enterococcus rivorum TaxID=762845 RepID=A0A1E5L0Z6_9ENTE|nr:uncharacterized protein YpmS [Enterococcus rivorum]OEH83589.1 hypothetical protein BCR26_08915 [Enterococcus rivorum]
MEKYNDFAYWSLNILIILAFAILFIYLLCHFFVWFCNVIGYLYGKHKVGSTRKSENESKMD